MLSQLGDWAVACTDSNRDSGELVRVYESQAGERCDLRAEIPAEDLDRSPLWVLEGAREDSLWLVVHRGCDRPLRRSPVRPHDLVAPAPHRVDAGRLQGAAIPTVERHHHLENDFSIGHIDTDLLG